MTSSSSYPQMADEVLRAPKAERWSTLHKFYAFDRPFILNELVDRFARSEELKAAYLRDLGDTTRACDSLRRELQEAKKAKESWPQDVEQIARLKADVANERANANNLGVSLTRLQLQANGWKEENEQLRKERDQLRQELSATQINLHDHAAGIAAVIKQREEAEKRAKLLGDENQRLRKELYETPPIHGTSARNTDQAPAERVFRFWQLVIQRGMYPRDADKLLREADEVLLGLNKA